MYQIRRYHIYESWHETLHEVVSGAMAYEIATEYHAATMGLHGDEGMNKEHAGPWAIMITDKLGNSLWQECSRLRCPSGEKRLFH